MANDDLKQAWKIQEPTLREIALVSCFSET